MRRRFVSVLGLLGLAALSACSTEAEPRAQTVVVLDTDLPLSGDVDAGLAQAARVDTLLVEALSADGTVQGRFEKTAPARIDWPVSLGVVGAARLRVRLFRAKDAGRDADGTPAPVVAATVDRVVDLAAPAALRTVRVVLRGDCFGHRPTFGASTTTCIDQASPSGAPSQGIEELADRSVASLVGTWPPAREVPCPAAPPEGRVCVPGGVSFLGDDTLGGFVDGVDVMVETAPMRLVRLTPFFMDRTEVTVGELRALLAEHPSLLGPEDLPGKFTDCTWTDAPGGGESLPLVCVTLAAARSICAAKGGLLPTEAQWEHAARGRESRRFPWGDAEPKCCTAALAGKTLTGGPGPCGIGGLAPVGAHATGDCATHDVSRDGVLDLGGNARELTRDLLVPYGTGCWAGTEMLVDPTCPEGELRLAGRGGTAAAGFRSATAAIRHALLAEGQMATSGFRCVYAP